MLFYLLRAFNGDFHLVYKKYYLLLAFHSLYTYISLYIRLVNSLSVIVIFLFYLLLRFLLVYIGIINFRCDILLLSVFEKLLISVGGVCIFFQRENTRWEMKMRIQRFFQKVLHTLRRSAKLAKPCQFCGICAEERTLSPLEDEDVCLSGQQWMVCTELRIRYKLHCQH